MFWMIPRMHLKMQDAGDLVLSTVVGIIRKCIRRSDILIRYGGDEFLLILPDVEEEIFSKKLK